MAFITTAQSALFSLLTASTNAAALRVTDLDLRTAPANYKAQLGSFLKALATVVTSLDTALAALRTQYSNVTAAAALNVAGATVTNIAAVPAVPVTITGARVVVAADPAVAPGASPNDLVFKVLKNGSTLVASKTFNNVTALPTAGTSFALTLSSTAADLALAAGDTLSCQIVMNGTTKLNAAVTFTVAAAAA